MPMTSSIVSAPAHLAHCGTLFSSEGGKDRFASYAFLRPVLRELWCLYDHYASEAEYADVPWWYGERTVVGHLTAAAFRAGYCALEDFTCEKGPGEPKGRLDWVVGRNQWREAVQAEIKSTWVSVDAAWDGVDLLLKEAAEKVAEYETTLGVKTLHKLAMVLVRPYYPKGQSYEDQRRAWIGEEDAYLPAGADFCAYYWLAKPYVGACMYGKCYHPGLLICCKEVNAG